MRERQGGSVTLHEKDDRGGLLQTDHPITSPAFLHCAQEFSGQWKGCFFLIRLKILAYFAGRHDKHQLFTLCLMSCFVICTLFIMINSYYIITGQVMTDSVGIVNQSSLIN